MLKWFKKAWFQLGTVLAIIGVIPTLFFIYDKYNIENVAAQQIRDKIYKEHREKILLENKINESEEPLKLSSMSGNTLSKSALALLYSLKGGVEEKRAKVIASKLIDDLEKFDEINIPDASFYLYYFYKYGVGVSVNNSISMNYLKKSANLKFPAAMYELGKQEETENLNSKGTLLIKSAANHGHIDAMALYGIIYYKDNGSISWLKKAAENGHAGSAMQLAKYDSIKNYRYWLKKASDNGSELATLKLVNEQLDNGDSSNINIMIDLASREHPYTPYAQYELGQYYKGKTNYSMWSKWNHMAAENNHPEALVEEGVYSLKNGRIDKAKSYFSKSKTIKTPGLYYHFGMINILTGDYKEAYYSLADAIRSESSYVKNKKKVYWRFLFCIGHFTFFKNK
ncbi:sel1 repeat family protein [Vibrio sp. B1FLJ16]|uniref:sel1 repeat family protein n=1 Tax=Vibrio sp. B1FLJ16 TaxID=2751178 RepID=UPI0015F4D8E1|nr:sel1 repeat family protein [Vibrio sp. B1FLJ16]CAD7798536.1 hypothetical protein ACOMICROBIO_EPCKBFOG_00358 [Vibrio sp. B1FLJ16]CAE6883951.1 hypothetical protein ACOMICROBIO_EPCKBFOG_00358 [Vibrio sp. B1FLJ16]